jgi:hypothetical protein
MHTNESYNYPLNVGEIGVYYMVKNLDFRKKEILDAFTNDCVFFLGSQIYDPEYISHFRLKIKVRDDGNLIEIVGDNLLTNLWILGIYPDDINKVINDEYYVDPETGNEYTLTPARKKLKIKYKNNAKN